MSPSQRGSKFAAFCCALTSTVVLLPLSAQERWTKEVRETLEDARARMDPSDVSPEPTPPEVSLEEPAASGVTGAGAAAAPESSDARPGGLWSKIFSSRSSRPSEALPATSPFPASSSEPVNDEESKRERELRRDARDNFRKGRFADAVRNINDLITLRPYEADYHFALGLCYRSERRYKEALKKYQDVLDLGGSKSLVAVLKAEAHAADGNKEEAYAELKKAAMGGRNIIADVNDLAALRKFRGDTDFIRLALQLERFEANRGLRFDPFTNPFQKAERGPVTDVGPKRDNGILSKEKQAELLREAMQLADRIQFYIRLQDEEKAMDAYLKLKKTLEKRGRITVPKIEQEFRVIAERLPDIEVQISGIRLKYYYNRLQKMLRDMRDVFEDGDYARVEKIHAEIQSVVREMKSANEKFREIADMIVERADRWLSRARVRLEFEKRKPDIQGIIISGDEKMTILGTRVVKQGEILNDLRVVRIESNRVTFRYKGEEIPLVFRRY